MGVLGLTHQEFQASSTLVGGTGINRWRCCSSSGGFFRQGPQAVTASGSCFCHCGVIKNIYIFTLCLLPQSPRSSQISPGLDLSFVLYKETLQTTGELMLMRCLWVGPLGGSRMEMGHQKHCVFSLSAPPWPLERGGTLQAEIFNSCSTVRLQDLSRWRTL